MATAIETIDLMKHYRQGEHVVKALDGVTMKVDPGEFVAVVGRSGSGKTTLLDLVGLLARPTSGRILLDGQDTETLRDAQRADVRAHKIGFVFQSFNLLPTLTGLENVMLPLRYAGNSKGGKERALELLAAVDLKGREHHRPDQLSGGEQQRVAIARALVNRPSVVLGDEPTGEVDTEQSGELIALMRKMNREEGVTFILVSHDPEVAAKTDRMIRLKDGRILEDSAVEEGVLAAGTV